MPPEISKMKVNISVIRNGRFIKEPAHDNDHLGRQTRKRKTAQVVENYLGFKALKLRTAYLMLGGTALTAAGDER